MGEQKKENRKVKYTKMVLREALLSLMEDRPINKITVTDICEKADINRGTFYTHYTDHYDLLAQIEGELFDEVRRALYDMSTTTDTAAVVLEIIRCLERNGDLCKIIFSEYGDADFLKKIMFIAHDHCLQEWATKATKTAHVPVEYLYSFTANGTVGILQKWIDDDMQETVEEVAQMVTEMSAYGTYAFYQE